ncbi:MAG: sigma-70 family RNA polymerase sigma factor [Pedobacter sp.]|nr:MAG: sigma-70 family RNA polymerase sigma factor [Pedobacter sp.]
MKLALNEKAQLEGLAKNDKEIVEMIYAAHYNMVQSLIVHNNGSSDDARDIFQETMIVLYEKSRSPGFELNCQLKTYIYSVARRLWLKKLSQSQRFGGDIGTVTETVPVEEDLEQHDQQSNDFSMMEKAMSGLGEPCKSLLEAFYLQKRNMTDIASQFGYTNADNAKNQKYKCLTRLRKLFFAQYKNKQ